MSEQTNEPDGWTVLFGVAAMCFVVIPGIAVMAALSVRFTIWLLFALGLLP